MTRILSLPYGTSSLQINIDKENTLSYFEKRKTTQKIMDPVSVRSYIKTYFSDHLKNTKFKSSFNIGITVNDKTRPVPNEILLSPLLCVLEDLGVQKKNITIFIASGTHSPMRKDELFLILPENIYDSYDVLPHNCDDNDNLSHLGVTSRETSVFVNNKFYASDLKIVIGDIEPHHFAGFSGGVKSAAIGLGGRQTINQNHSLLMDHRSIVGNFYNNPLRQDIEEIGKMIGIDYAINAILDEDKNILNVFCGKPDSVMGQGILFSKAVNSVPMAEHFDLVIASAGGYPKDINFYQAQKALTHASLFCKKGAKVILVAECSEGIGSEKYLDFMKRMNSHTQVIEYFSKNGFEVGPHKAFQVAIIANDVNFKLYSSIDNALLSKLLIEPIADLQSEITTSIAALPGDARIAVIPYATATIPEYKE